MAIYPERCRSLSSSQSAGANPCGADLEYDRAFLDLERMVQGKPEQQMGKTVVAAEEPDWHAVAKAAAALLLKTKDLRIAFQLDSGPAPH